jgi:hypothetical protein
MLDLELERRNRILRSSSMATAGWTLWLGTKGKRVSNLFGLTRDLEAYLQRNNSVDGDCCGAFKNLSHWNTRNKWCGGRPCLVYTLGSRTTPVVEETCRGRWSPLINSKVGEWHLSSLRNTKTPWYGSTIIKTQGVFSIRVIDSQALEKQ